MNRLLADLLAARVFLAMLSGDPAQPIAQRRDTHHIYETGKARKTILLLHGLTMTGEADPRLVRLARALAAGGLRVVVPIFEHLKDYRFDPADRGRLLEVAARFKAETDAPLVVIAFSAGGSLALAAAADPAGRELFGPLVLFSPLYDFEAAWQAFHAQSTLPMEGTTAWDDFIWVQCVIAWRNRDRLGLSPTVTGQLKELFLRWPVDLSTNEKRDFYETTLKPLNLPGLAEYFHEGKTLAQLSPRGKLHELTQRVLLLLSPDDSLLSAEEIGAFHAELCQRKTGRTWLLSTPLLAHANLSAVTRPQDAFLLVHYLGEVFV